jgi:hypothetical protein
VSKIEANMLTPFAECVLFVTRRGYRRIFVVLLLSLQAAVATSQEAVRPRERVAPEVEKARERETRSGKSAGLTDEKARWLWDHPGRTTEDYKFWKTYGRLPEPGETNLTKIGKDIWFSNHPGRTEKDYEYWKEHGRLPKVHLQIDPNNGPVTLKTPSLADSKSLGGNQSLRRTLFGPTREEVEAAGTSLLKAPEARGWGYVGYVEDFFSSKAEEVRVTAGHAGNEEVDKFLIVDKAHQPLLAGSDFSHQNTIVARGDDLQNEDLRSFLQVNNRFLRDVPRPAEVAANDSPAFPTLQDSSTMAVTSARLPSGKEVVTVFALSDSAQTGSQHGEVYAISPGSFEVLDLKQRLADAGGQGESSSTGLFQNRLTCRRSAKMRATN